MFGLLTRSRRSPLAPRSFRPCLEGLETRCCPSALTLNAACTTQNNVTFSGQLTGAPVEGGQTINITGPGGLQTTATTDANGNYSVTIPVAANQLGNVMATHVWNSMMDAAASVSVNPLAPTITNFKAIQEQGGYWEFTGTVTGTPDPQGMTITFSGLPEVQGQTTTVAANGTFDVVFQLNGDAGDVNVMTTDWWGQVGTAGTSVV
jgi:hypothetical protein